MGSSFQETITGFPVDGSRCCHAEAEANSAGERKQTGNIQAEVTAAAAAAAVNYWAFGQGKGQTVFASFLSPFLSLALPAPDH